MTCIFKIKLIAINRKFCKKVLHSKNIIIVHQHHQLNNNTNNITNTINMDHMRFILEDEMDNWLHGWDDNLIPYEVEFTNFTIPPTPSPSPPSTLPPSPSTPPSPYTPPSTSTLPPPSPTSSSLPSLEASSSEEVLPSPPPSQHHHSQQHPPSTPPTSPSSSSTYTSPSPPPPKEPFPPRVECEFCGRLYLTRNIAIHINKIHPFKK